MPGCQRQTASVEVPVNSRSGGSADWNVYYDWFPNSDLYSLTDQSIQVQLWFFCKIERMLITKKAFDTDMLRDLLLFHNNIRTTFLL